MSVSGVPPNEDEALDPNQRKPTSKAKIHANRRNSLRSTGPRTARGKRAVAGNAGKHWILAREVVIRAGTGKENLEEFAGLLIRLHQDYAPIGGVEGMLVERIATCWWRLARVIRAENGEIRTKLDSAVAEYCLSRSEKVTSDMFNLDVLSMGKLFNKDADQKLSSQERFAMVQKSQNDLKRNYQGVQYLIALLQEAKTQLTTQGYISDQLHNVVRHTFNFYDYLELEMCFAVGHGKEPRTDDDSIESSDVGGGNVRAAIAIIDSQLKILGCMEQHEFKRTVLEIDAEARSLSLPSENATGKIIRYETHLDRQLYRAMDQLERLQRQCKGEKMPPPLNINLGHRN